MIEMDAKLIKKILIVSNFIVLVIVLFFNGSGNLKSIFPKPVGDVSNKFPTDIAPSGSTFAIWGFIYFFQVGWVFRSLYFLKPNTCDDAKLTAKFYIFFILSSLCNLSWLLVFSREMVGLALGFLLGIVICLALCLDQAGGSLFNYLQKFPDQDKTCFDVWCIRLFVLNGIIFYATWVTIATCLNFVIAMHYRGHVNAENVASGALAFILVLAITWFLLENFLYQNYTRFVFMEYVVLIVATSGILKKNWTDGKGNQGFVLGILVISSVLLVARIILVIVKEKANWKEKKNVDAEIAKI